jgi:hypothetical protein
VRNSLSAETVLPGVCSADVMQLGVNIAAHALGVGMWRGVKAAYGYTAAVSGGAQPAAGVAGTFVVNAAFLPPTIFLRKGLENQGGTMVKGGGRVEYMYRANGVRFN